MVVLVLVMLLVLAKVATITIISATIALTIGQSQAAAVLEHCLQRYAQHGDETSRDTVMKLAQVFSAHAACSTIVLAFALSSVAAAFQMTAAPSESCRLRQPAAQHSCP